MSASTKWRYLGHLQLLSKAVAAMAEMEVSPQGKMANTQGIKVFAVERHGLPEDFVSFPALCVCVCIFFPFILDIKFVGRTSRGHTGFLIHLLSAVRALIFLARGIQPFLSLVDREVDFCVLMI